MLQGKGVELWINHTFEVITIAFEVAEHVLDDGLVIELGGQCSLLGFLGFELLDGLWSEGTRVESEGVGGQDLLVDDVSEVLGIELLHVGLVEVVFLFYAIDNLSPVVGDVAVEGDVEAFLQQVSLRP